MKKFKFKRKALTLLLFVLAFSFVLPVMPFAAAEVDAVKVIPGGMAFGVQLQTKGVIVSALTSVRSEKGDVCPAEKADIRVGDILYEVDGRAVNHAESLITAVNLSKGREIEFCLLRKGKRLTVSLTPVLSQNDGLYKAGVAVRDSAAGIGTVTFIDEKSMTFTGLGHGICDCETGVLMPLLSARVSDVTLTGIQKGKCGAPGALKGYFSSAKKGYLMGNTERGVYGALESLPQNALQSVKLAKSSELKEGKAHIYCTVDSGGIGMYEIQIVKITDRESDCKNFVVKVTDKRLVEKTGGIVQGMSGSPIIQNGKLVGAVTHV